MEIEDIYILRGKTVTVQVSVAKGFTTDVAATLTSHSLTPVTVPTTETVAMDSSRDVHVTTEEDPAGPKLTLRG